MSEKNFEFINIQRIEPEVKPLEIRKVKFDEIYEKQSLREAKEQSSRCLDCGNPYCEWKCPLHNYIPNWLKLVEEGEIEQAADLCHETNAFPEICGRICPQEKLCEGACTLNTGYEAVTIGQVEKFISDTALERGWKPKKITNKKLDIHVSIIGAGPAGLACAETLIRRGANCTVYDRYKEIGGLLTYGIPEFKLEKKVIKRRRKILEELGVKFVMEFDVDAKNLHKIESKSDAIFLGLGVYESIKSNIEGDEKDGVVEALPYLIKNTEYLMDIDDPLKMDFSDQKVVVLGGGDTAMDCVRTALRQKATSVTCVYRRDRENMPGSAREVNNAEEEGVEFVWLSAPKEFIGKNKVEGVIVDKIILGEPDESGRKKPIIKKDSEYKIKSDLVIKALGFDPENLPKLFNCEKLELTKWGTIKIDFDSMQTSMPGVFAAGDIVRGASLVVWAIKDGRDAATSIKNFLERNEINKAKVA